MDFSDRHVVITGGTGGLGPAVVEFLLAKGATCHIPNFEETELVRFSFREHAKVRIETGVDLTDEALIGAFYAGLPSLWASVHLAGGFDMTPVLDIAARDFDRMMMLNAKTCFLSSREAVRTIRENGGGGRIVNVAARPAIAPAEGRGMTAYAASKAAVAAFTQALDAEVAAEGIFVNAVAPSIIDTPQNRTAMPDADFEAWPKPGEIARAIGFLASPENRLVHGAILPVYGRA